MNVLQGWAIPMVAHQWPSDAALAQLNFWKLSREYAAATYDFISDSLESAWNGPLAIQEGKTADSLMQAFDEGKRRARNIATKNRAKAYDYEIVANDLNRLRTALFDIAERGKKEIQDIQNSEMSIGDKTSAILAVISEKQQEANVAGGKSGAEIGDAGQRILDREEPGQSFRQFAKDHGVDMSWLFRARDPKGLEPAVTHMLGNPSSVNAHGAQANPQIPTASAPPQAGSAVASTAEGGQVNPQMPAVPPPQPGVPAPALTAGGNQANRAPPSLATPAPPGLPAAPATPNVPAVGGGPALPATPAVSGAPLTAQPGVAPGLTPPTTWSANPNLGAMSPTPVAPSGFDSALAAAPPPAAPPAPPVAAANTAWHTPFIETAPPPEPAPPAYTAPVDSPVVAAPAVANPGLVAPASTPPAGPLPAYGADLRPPAATVPTPPPSPPPSAAAPLAAPTTHPTAGAGGLTNAAPVRPPPGAVPPEPSSGLAGQAVVATAGGAAVGAVSGDAAARDRLQRIVDTVARQEPQLAWAAGDRPDGTTVLATDLASGWIPPGIAIPVGVTLPQPGWRRGGLDSLLGEVNLRAGYLPTHHVPEDDDPLPTSPRSRRAPEVEELGWELNQATHWRDGLPRLAHTLAKAAGAGTGVLDSEIDLLHQELAKVRDRVLTSYPDDVDVAAVGDWQLLAAIAALIAGDKTAANYHFAWFQALGRAR